MTLPTPPALLCAAYAPPSAGASPESQTLNLKPTRFRIIRCENPPVQAQLHSEISNRSTVPIHPKLEADNASVYVHPRNCPFDRGLLSKRCVDINIGITALSPPLRESTTKQLLEIIGSLGASASFNRILSEASRQGALAWHRTLRRYLDLLVDAGCLKVEEREVGSVNLQQLYWIRQRKPTLWAGPAILQIHGLNWDIPDHDLYSFSTDLAALTRARQVKLGNKQLLAAGREDCLAQEIRRDDQKETGTIELVVAILATHHIDLHYFFKRSDELMIGKAARLLLERLAEIFTGPALETDARTFLVCRERFLKIPRTYSKEKSLEESEQSGTSRRGLYLVKNLHPLQIVKAAGKQLGLIG